MFLTSAGLPKETRDYFLKFFGKDPKESSVAFIPTAADPEEDKWFVDSAKKELADLGFEITGVDLKDHDEKSLNEVLEDKDIIYINGGNTYYLMCWVRRSGLDKIIESLLNNGITYVGTSAGSIIAGPNISLAGWEPFEDVNGIQLEDLGGLNLVDFAISPHFQMDSIEKLEKRKRKFPYKVIALTDSQAIEVTDRDYKIIGPGSVTILE